MKLMQDSTQKLSTATLLGAGINTNSDGGNSLSNPNKKLMFADDLRQQINEAVATSKSRKLLTSTTEAEARPQHSAYSSNDQITVVAHSGASVEPHAAIDPKASAADTIAARGSFLPPAEPVLPAGNVSQSIERVNIAASAPGSVTGVTAVFSFSNLSFGSVTELPGSNFPISEGLPLSIDLTPDSNIQSFGETDLAIMYPSFDVTVDSPEISAWMPLPNPLTASALQAPAPVNLNLHATPTEAESVEPDLLAIDLTRKLSSIQAALTDDTATKPTVLSVLGIAELDQSDAKHTLLGALDSMSTEPLASDNNISQFPATLTAAYDLSLPDVMPEGVFALSDEDVTETSAIPLLFSAQPMDQQDLSASATPPAAGLMLQTEPSTETASAVNHTQSATAVDLLTKGAEPVSTTSNRSAYVNSLIASLLGNTHDTLSSPALTPDTSGQSRLISAGPATTATDLMQGLQGQAELIAPTKSLLSDQQLLANVAALSSEASFSSQSASIYSADQRLQLASEARQAHLQGMQTFNTPADAALARASGTMMAAMDVSFGQAGWAERIGRQILLQSAQGNSTAQIQLDPPELGSLVIKLQLVDQTATVNFASPHAMVRDALEQQIQRLQEMFKEQGMNLLDVSVSDQSANSRQDAERQSAGNGNSSGNPSDSSEQDSPVIVRQSNSLIDYYA